VSGLVVLGDSITRAGDGEAMLGVPFRSWARWLADAIGLPATLLAWDGAVAADLVSLALPQLHGHYDVGCLYVGVNDARSLGWDPQDFEGRVSTLLDALAARCDRLVVFTLPRDLGRPTSAPKPAAANALLRAAAARRGATVVALDDFGGRLRVLPDVVHPTASGQLEIARRASVALGVRPPAVVADLSPRARTRWAARYALLLARDLWRRAVERRTLVR
jgi:GDSL-like Lipase/Acylhydrolase family